MSSFYKCLGRGCDSVKTRTGNSFRLNESGFYQLSKGLAKIDVPTTVESRASFCQAFGILPSMQRRIEKHYDELILDTTIVPGGAPGIFNYYTLPINIHAF
jgi:hypothetical protein